MRDLQAAAFLAGSWFWCIGGFFPVLLFQEFGGVSFPVFLAFNVIGATLFGLVWTNAARLNFLDRFGGFARGFSALVAGVHVVFMVWISLMVQDVWPVAGFILLTGVFTMLRDRLYGLSFGLLAVTIGLFAIILLNAAPPRAPAQTEPFVHQIAPLAFGFLLAPFFDLTFHRAFARAASPRRAFLVGFCALFAVLLCGVYFGMDAFAGLTTAGGLSSPVTLAAAAILVVQTSFTTAAHLAELKAVPWRPTRTMIAGAIIVAGFSLAQVIAASVSPEVGRTIGELIYRSFIFLVGVIFPVFLLFGGLNRYALAVIAFVTPCYSLGFLIGGAFAPFLSVAMLGMALFYWRRPAQAGGAFRKDRLAGEAP